jgi:hypothetical protein
MAKLYKLFTKFKKGSQPNLLFDGMGLVKYCENGKNYEIYFTKRRANKRTFIYCEENTIVWEQLPLLAMSWGSVFGKRRVLMTIAPVKDVVRIVVIMGKPNCITGLDDGIFRSVHKYDENYVNVMSVSRFKKI